MCQVLRAFFAATLSCAAFTYSSGKWVGSGTGAIGQQFSPIAVGGEITGRAGLGQSSIGCPGKNLATYSIKTSHVPVVATNDICFSTIHLYRIFLLGINVCEPVNSFLHVRSAIFCSIFI